MQYWTAYKVEKIEKQSWIIFNYSPHQKHPT